MTEIIDIAGPLENSLNLLLGLHKLMRTGKSDTPEADAIRDELDTPWQHLTEKQKHLVGMVSAALYEDKPDG